MLRLLIIALVFFASNVKAEGFGAIGASGRLIKNDEGNYVTKFPLLGYGGFRNLPWAYAVEGLYFQDKSNAGSSFKITNDHYEATLYALYFIKYEDARAINPYVVGGVGAFQSHVTTDFLGSSDKDKSKINSVVKFGGGAWATVGTRTFVNLELKALYSKDYSPDLVIDFTGRVGLEF